MAHLYSVQMYFCNKILISRVPLYRVKNTSFVLHCSDIFQEIELSLHSIYIEKIIINALTHTSPQVNTLYLEGTNLSA